MSAGEFSYYTRDEVLKKNGKDESNIWIIYKDGVYDVTAFINEHPGGSDVILEQAGKDATKAFNSVGHSSDAKTMLNKRKIGELRPEDRLQPKRKIVAETDDNSNRSCINIVTCGLIG